MAEIKPMLYVGYLNDPLFRRRTAYMESDKVYPQCVVDRRLANYFHKQVALTDRRESRLQFSGKALAGTLSFHYDGDKYENDIFVDMSKSHLDTVFNIIDMVFLANGSGEEELNGILVNTEYTKSIYVKDTLILSRKAVKATMYDIDSETPEKTISMPTYFQFTISLGTGNTHSIKVYLDRESFLAEYPYSTINNVILPCDHAYILDPSLFEGNVDALIKSTSYSLSDLDPSIITDDHTSLFTYYTRYITKSKQNVTQTSMLPFGILYQGKRPTTLEIREAIREEILRPGIAPQTVWETILPDIFVTAQFFICPIWDNYTARANGVLYPSVVNAKKYIDAIRTLFPDMDRDYIDKYQEMLVCGQSELFLTSIPDPSNADEFSILKKHPTYQLHMSQAGNAFINQDPETRDFNTRLNRAMAVACGMEVQSDILTQEFDGKTWHSFTSSKTEYHILSELSYNELFDVDEEK